MFGLVRKWSQQIWLALFWSVVTTVLLCLPGSVFPGTGLFSIPNLDKVVHIGLFGGLVFFWYLFFYFRSNNVRINIAAGWAIVCVTVAYGTLMEFVQRDYIPNRSFDTADILADLVGSLIGYFVTQWFVNWHTRHDWHKKNSPCRNRGCNQN